MVLGLISVLVSFVLPIVLVVWAVRHLSGREGARGVDSRSVRRFFQYALLFSLLIVAAAGLSSLVGLLFQDSALVDDDRTALARALTFTLFGIPMFALAAAWTRRRLQEDPDESRSLGWAVYATVAPLTALVVAMFALFDVVSAALNQRFDGVALAELAVWASVWLLHRMVADRTLEADRQQGQLVVGALVGLGTAVAGLVRLLGTSLEVLVLHDVGNLLGSEQTRLAQAAALVVVGVPVWVVYWLRGLARARRTVSWFGYVLPVGVGGSLVLTVVGASVAVYQTLVWLVGEPTTSLVEHHFRNTPTAVACVLVGAVSWWYHQHVLAAAAPGRTEVTRVYEYLMAGISLLAAAVGVTLLVVAVIEALVPPAAVEVGVSVANSLIAALTLLVVGGPLWWVFWSRIERIVRADGSEKPDDLASPTRRIYLLVLFGLGGVAAAISILVAAFIGIQGALQDGFDAQVVRDMRVPVAILLATGAISGYHWTVYREDRSRLPAPEPRRGPFLVVLIGAPDDGVRAAVEHLTGARVDLWVRSDGLADPWVAADVVAAVRRVGVDAVTVVSGPAGLEAIGMRHST